MCFWLLFWIEMFVWYRNVFKMLLWGKPSHLWINTSWNFRKRSFRKVHFIFCWMLYFTIKLILPPSRLGLVLIVDKLIYLGSQNVKLMSIPCLLMNMFPSIRISTTGSGCMGRHRHIRPSTVKPELFGDDLSFNRPLKLTTCKLKKKKKEATNYLSSPISKPAHFCNDDICNISLNTLFSPSMRV